MGVTAIFMKQKTFFTFWMLRGSVVPRRRINFLQVVSLGARAMASLPSYDRHYVNGQWIPSSSGKFFDVTDSNTGQAGDFDVLATGGWVDG